MQKVPAQILQRLLREKAPLRIKLLGDSITHGVGGTGFQQNGEPIVENFARNPEGYCWAKRFAEYMKETYGATVINNACTGTNIQFVIKHFDTLVEAEDDLILCTIGTNNRSINFKTGYKPSREELGEQVYQNMLSLCERFLAAGKPVILMANIPASAKNEQDGDYFWRILHMDDINALWKKAAAEKSLPLISLYDLFSAHCREHSLAVDELLCDGLHPNDRGYDVMYELLLKELKI